MKNWYKCDSCGCYLDPNEGLLCDECRKLMTRRIQRSNDFASALFENADGQYQMKLQEVG